MAANKQSWITEVIEIWSSPGDFERTSPDSFLCYAKLHPMLPRKKKSSATKLDLDCVILDYNPFEPPVNDGKKLDFEGKDVDLAIIAERGQVACRDYPHSRHLCAQFPFDTTGHERHCKQCYCYVCDTLAPCKDWKLGGHLAHCHAYESDPFWKHKRKGRRPRNPTSKDYSS